MIRELDLNTVADRVPAELLEASQEELAPSSPAQTPNTTQTPAHLQGGEREVYTLITYLVNIQILSNCQ